MEKFVEYIEEEVKRLYETFPRHPMRKLIDKLKREHEPGEKCHICPKEFNDPRNRKVRDHCHYIDLYRRAAHNNCNLNCLIPDYIPTVFHNLSGYDGEGGLTKVILGSLQRTWRNTSVLMLRSMSSWLGLSIKMVHKCIKSFSLRLWTAVDLWHQAYLN